VIRKRGAGRLLRGGERGQAIWWILLIFPLFLIGAAITIDASVWLGHRREYQKTSDASALAGGQELLTRTDSSDMTGRATTASDEWMSRNNRPPADFVNDTPDVVSDCWGVPSFDGLPDGVIVDVSKEAPLLIMKAFGITPFNIGAHAKVCVGSPQEAKGMLPFGIPVNTSDCFSPGGVPLFGQRCEVSVRVPAGESGEAQYLKLYDDWSRLCSDTNARISQGDFIGQVARGARTWCRVATSSETCPDAPGPDETGHCARSEPGNRADWTIEGLQCRVLGAVSVSTYCTDIPGEGECDALYGDGDGIDQWSEALYALGPDPNPPPGPHVTYVKRDCTAPRLVTVILLDDYLDPGNPERPIRGFAGFFIEGCRDDDGVFNPWCITENEEKYYPGRGPYLSNSGHLWVVGMFINYVDIGGPGGPATPYGRMQLYMVE
jgi:hypothetical protein